MPIFWMQKVLYNKIKLSRSYKSKTALERYLETYIRIKKILQTIKKWIWTVFKCRRRVCLESLDSRFISKLALIQFIRQWVFRISRILFIKFCYSLISNFVLDTWFWKSSVIRRNAWMHFFQWHSRAKLKLNKVREPLRVPD